MLLLLRLRLRLRFKLLARVLVLTLEDVAETDEEVVAAVDEDDALPMSLLLEDPIGNEAPNGDDLTPRIFTKLKNW